MTGARAAAAAAWIERLRAGDRAALARAITAVENETADAPALYAAIYPHLGKALVVGVTGPPGVGKSTLVDAYVDELRRRGATVGVVAVDPSSPVSGGAILGDRIRMGRHATDPEVFVRSMASRGHLGGLSRTAARVIDVLDAAGKDVIVVETVGAGQSEVEIAGIADTKVVVCAPGLGDDIQAIKAGILEIADVLVVNKADLPLAERAVRQLEGMLALTTREGWAPPVLRTTATTGEGIADLAEAVAGHAAVRNGDRPPRTSPLGRVRKLISGRAAEMLRRRIESAADRRVEALCDAVLKGEIDFDEAAARAVEALAERRDG